MRDRLVARLKSVFETAEVENRLRVLEYVDRYGPFERVIDLGCFDGLFTLEVANAADAGEVSGVEFLEEHARVARRRGIHVTVSDLSGDLPIASDLFDLVHSNQVIEHLTGTDQFLREVHRILKPGGTAIISTNNLASWHNVVSLCFGFQPAPAHVSDEVHVGHPLNPAHGTGHRDAGATHLRIFTGRALDELAGFHGLELVESGVSGYYPLIGSAARRLADFDSRHAAFLIGVYRKS